MRASTRGDVLSPLFTSFAVEDGYLCEVFAMTVREIELTRRLLRELELLELPEWIGRRYVAHDFADLQMSRDLLASGGFEGEALTEASNLERTLIAYRFVDLRFHVARRPHATWRMGAAAARALIHEPTFTRQEENSAARDVRIQALEDACAELDSGGYELRVMAKAFGLPDLSLRQRFEINTGRVERDFPLFPRELEVFDAYVTNAPTAGLGRHFYL